MKLNRLSLNYSKSTYFIVKPFSYNSKNIALDDFNVSIGQHKINSTIYTKYEGQSISNETFLITQVCNDW